MFHAGFLASCLDSPAQWDAHFDMFDPAEGHEFYVHGYYHYDKTGLRKARFEEVDEGRNSSYRFVEQIDLYAEVMHMHAGTVWTRLLHW